MTPARNSPSPDARPSPDPGKTPSRLGLYAPFAALLLAVAAWALGWTWMRAEVFRRMDAAAIRLSELGYRLDWSHREISGFPFRLDLDLAGPRLREQTGWGFAAPRLEAEAFVFAPDHWVVVAPAGLTLQRRLGGPVAVGAHVLRASLSEANAHPPRLSVEGLGLSFAPGPGARPVALTGAAELHIHLRAGPGDQGALYLELDRAPAQGRLGQWAAGEPLTLVADGIFSHAGALRGQGFAGALRGWSNAGGELTLRRLSLQGGGAGAEATAGTLGVGVDGRLKGAVNLGVRQAARLLALLAAGPEPASVHGAPAAAMAVVGAHEQGGVATVTVHFQAGQTTLGPVAIGPSPRVY